MTACKCDTTEISYRTPAGTLATAPVRYRCAEHRAAGKQADKLKDSIARRAHYLATVAILPEPLSHASRRDFPQAYEEAKS